MRLPCRTPQACLRRRGCGPIVRASGARARAGKPLFRKVAMESPSQQPFLSEIEEFERRDREQPPPRGAVLFLGSSSIRLWHTLEADFPAVRLLNRGFGGSKIEDSIRYVRRIVLPYAPRQVVFYAGDNDLAGGKTPGEVLADYRELVRLVHAALPDCRIAFVSIKPSPRRARLLGAFRETNVRIRAFSETDPRLDYIDVFTPMLAADGAMRPELYIEDGLHMTAAGYEVWRHAIAPSLV